MFTGGLPLQGEKIQACRLGVQNGMKRNINTMSSPKLKFWVGRVSLVWTMDGWAKGNVLTRF